MASHNVSKRRKAKDPIKTFKRLLSFIFVRYKLLLPIVFIGIMLSTGARLGMSVFLEVLIDEYITPLVGVSDPDFSSLISALFIMGGIFLAGVIGTLTFNLLMVSISQGTLRELRDSMFSHMQKLPLSYFDSNTHGNLMSRYTNDTDTLRQFITQGLPQMAVSIVTIVGVFTTMLILSPHLTLVAILTVIINLVVVRKVVGLSGKNFSRQQETLGKTNGYVEEMISGQKVVKVFCHEEEAKAKFDELNDKLCQHSTDAHRYANILMPIMINFSHIQYVLIAITGGILYINGIGALTLGTIAAFLQLSRTLAMPIAQISQQLQSIVKALAGAERIFDLLDQEVEADKGSVTLVNAKYEDDKLVETEERTGILAWKQPQPDGSFNYTELKGDIRLNNIDFSYDGETPVLHNVSVHAKPGQKIALVGATGAGKTTISNLINRFYDLDDGKIRYDGININDIKKADLRRSLGVVLQDTSLFTGTVKENIRFGKLDATDEEIYEAARRSQADSFISMLPDGYETILSEESSNLSQGQRQLLSITRAQLTDAPVMILDEATSSIDSRTEAIVQRGMDELMKGRTVFVIAHRLSTIRNSDKILVLDQGRIIESGNHKELVANKGAYYQLYKGSSNSFDEANFDEADAL
ncbi:ABC transporter ATP-binding protein [Natranaerobius thermophilus]|uniref:ABC transporter related n=1 Tax=Natranaerobius thermophilus (strain ATCC BAA-1301 / DSM 18059 / JW/NM-WN-LF) TaxID=457570 RepID=B2A7V9_NATTJ|nr:ABC transporter ATP-binding protein [Natranaerobius thermophilus]ACB84407.1 ABC transporter related [Natranaerobius thermophilus JW/NM-WN-LF]